MGTETDNLRMFHTGAHPCGYWEGREARDLVLDPRDPRLPQAYPMALDWGFRRSGDIVYRPSCSGCHACVAVRIPVDGFRPDRSQRRCLARNADIDARIVAPVRTPEATRAFSGGANKASLPVAGRKSRAGFSA